MLMPTSHFLGQVWEFPICGSAPAEHNQDNMFLAVFLLFMLSIIFMIPLSHSREVLGVKSHLPCLEPDRRGVLGAVGGVLYKPRAAPWCCSGRRQSGRIPAASSCRIPALLAGGLVRKVTPNRSLELSAFSPGWQLGSEWAVCALCAIPGVPVPAFSGVAMSAQSFGWHLPSVPDWRKGFDPAWALSLFTLELPKVLTINFLFFLRYKSLPQALSVQ